MDSSFLNSDWSIYLDTSFILHTCYQCIDHKPVKVRNAEKEIWNLFYFKQWKCYISNIVISEVYSVVERTSLREYIDKKIIHAERETIKKWENYNTHTRQKLRLKYKDQNWFKISIKEWRTDPQYANEYRIKVINEIQNIFDSLPDFICLNSIWKASDTIDKFKNIKKQYIELDGNDINHYLICKENNISALVSCDADFSSISDPNLRIFSI